MRFQPSPLSGAYGAGTHDRRQNYAAQVMLREYPHGAFYGTPPLLRNPAEEVLYSSGSGGGGGGGGAAATGAGAELVGGIFSSVITGLSQSRMQKKQQAHEARMTRKQAKLYSAQAKLEEAKAKSSSAQGAVERASTYRTLLIVSGVVLGLATIAVAAVTIKQG